MYRWNFLAHCHKESKYKRNLRYNVFIYPNVIDLFIEIDLVIENKSSVQAKLTVQSCEWNLAVHQERELQ